MSSNLLHGLQAFGAIIAVYSIFRLAAFHFAKPRKTNISLLHGEENTKKTLVVIAHGLNRKNRFSGLVNLVSEAIPNADRLVIDYGVSITSNLDPYSLSDMIEREIHEKFKQNRYEEIILFGYSAGVAILRKALVWGHGQEEDRVAPGGKREWVDRVSRFVMLAGMNRGWRADKRPKSMGYLLYAKIRLGVLAARTFGIGRFVLAMRSGTPFIADSRIQWVRIARSNAVVEKKQAFPQVIHLIGSQDDLVTREDGQDLRASRGTVFKTLPQTGHRDIGEAIDGSNAWEAENRRMRIRQALAGDIESMEPDRVELPPEKREVSRIIYVVHGIRDYGNWTDEIRTEVEKRCDSAGDVAAVINSKYGYFPMIQFLIYSDRQTNVRRFMDEYTEHIARYPNAVHIDFAGHSNGTYILASAMQHYKTISVRRVFFAGSVVPKHYTWTDLIEANRIQRVINVVATTDWVVAIFPKVFEQISDLLRIKPVTGWLDLGAAGFRGFLESSSTPAVRNVKFTKGTHSTGVDVSDLEKLTAISDFLVSGNEHLLDVFSSEKNENKILSFLSNISPLIWMLIFAAIIFVGYSISSSGWVLLSYIVLLFLILNMI